MAEDRIASGGYDAPHAWVLILPKAHWKLLDLPWQHAAYELFHVRRISRIGHALCTAPIVLTWFAWAAMVPLGEGSVVESFPAATAVNGGLGLLGVLVLWYAFLDVRTAVLALPLLVLLWVGANVVVSALGPAAVEAAAAASVSLAVLQAASHVPEDIPPPWSGSPTFVPWMPWLRSTPPGRIAGYMFMIVVGPVLEYWASPRVLTCQLRNLLAHLGYRPERLAAARARAGLFRADIRTA